MRLNCFALALPLVLGAVGCQRTEGKIAPQFSSARKEAAAPNEPNRGTSVTIPGAISGRVFGILKNGDLKPARLASVMLFLETDSAGNGMDAGLTYQEQRLASISELSKRLNDWKRRRVHVTKEDVCSAELRAEVSAASGTLEWAQKNGLYQVEVTETDEEGEFALGKVAPGEWVAVAIGRSGANRAFWRNDVTIETGKTTILKMSNPMVACLDLE
jgi:hypothetical protein